MFSDFFCLYLLWRNVPFSPLVTEQGNFVYSVHREGMELVQ